MHVIINKTQQIMLLLKADKVIPIAVNMIINDDEVLIVDVHKNTVSEIVGIDDESVHLEEVDVPEKEFSLKRILQIEHLEEFFK